MPRGKDKTPKTGEFSTENLVGEPQVAYGASIPLEKVRFLGERYDMAIRDLADVLEVTPKTFHRWSNTRETLSPQQADRITILASIFTLGERVFRSRQRFTVWLHEPVLNLEGRTPLAMIKTESGRRAVENVLHQIEFGIY